MAFLSSPENEREERANVASKTVVKSNSTSACVLNGISLVFPGTMECCDFFHMKHKIT